MEKEETLKCTNCKSEAVGGGIHKIQISLPSGIHDLYMADVITYFYDISWTAILKDDSFPPLQISAITEVCLEFCQRCARLLEESYVAHLNFENATDPKSVVQKIKRFRIQQPEEECQLIKIEIDHDEEVEDDEFLKFKSQINGRCGNCHLLTKNLNLLSSLEEYELSEIYGISWEDFLLSFYKTSSRVEFCVECLSLLKENYKTRQKFENFTHAESIVQKAKEFRRTDESNQTEEKSASDLCDLINPIHNEKKKATSVLEFICLPKCIIQGQNVAVNIHKLSTSTINRLCKQRKGRQTKKIKTTKKRKKNRKAAKTTKKAFQCKECGMMFSLKSYLKAHTFKHGAPQFFCNLCGNSYKFPNGLRRHIQSVHDGATRINNKKRYQCKECGMMFSLKSYLKAHTFKHGAPQFLCNLCGNSYKFPNGLRRHFLIVHDVKEQDKRYQCKECGKRFDCNSSLQSHTYKHNGSRQFVCNRPHCGKSYKYPKGLSSHVQSCHQAVVRATTPQ